MTSEIGLLISYRYKHTVHQAHLSALIGIKHNHIVLTQFDERAATHKQAACISRCAHTPPAFPANVTCLKSQPNKHNKPQNLDLAESDTLEHLAGWEEIVGYLQTITLENLHLYVRLHKH
ncbi:TPA: hypothetical protein ACH3X1_013667 [Trebouxia sp. C0004]